MACLQIDKITQYVHSAPGTIYDGVDTFVYVGRIWTYKVYISPHEILDTDENIYLSYTGSGITNGIEFNAPQTVTILAGLNYVEFKVELYIDDNSYQKPLQISATSSLFNPCSAIINGILSKGSTPEDSAPISRIVGCTPDFIPERIEHCIDFFESYPALYGNVKY